MTRPRALHELCPGQVQLFFASVEGRDTDRLAADRELLDSDERARADRFIFERDRITFTVAHALVRRVLSRYAAVAPREWRYQNGSHGRPEIADPIASRIQPLRFNLSHSRGFAVCAVTLELDIGVDVEGLARPAPLEIVDSYFAPTEVAELHALPTEARADRFFEYWTLKESYIKARGLGLSLPLHEFAFLLRPPQPIGIEFGPGLLDDPQSWYFEAWQESARYRVAVALRNRGLPVRIERLLEDD